MSDNQTTEPGENTDPATKPEPKQNETDFVSKAEYDKLKKAHDQAAFDYRKLLGEIKDLRSKVNTGNPDEGGSKSKLELAEKEIKDLQDKLKAADATIYDFQVTNQVRQVAGKFVAEEAIEDFMALTKGQFEAVSDEKGQRISHKEHPWTPLEDVIDQLVRPYMRKTTRVNGTGPSAGPNTSALKGGDAVSVSQLEKMGTAERRAMLAKHPELRKAWSDKGFAS